MRHSCRVWRPVGLLLAAGMLLCVGCADLGKRMADAKDMFNVGITVSRQPRFSFYIGFLNILSVGYSHVDGTILGLGGREFGAVPMRHNAVGLVLWGREQLGYEDVDMSDPNSPKPWCVGPVGLAKGPGPRKRDRVNCPKLFHLGWLGFTLNCKFGEIADFVLGWFGLDIMDDDVQQPAATAPPA